LYRRLGGPQNRSGHRGWRKTLSPLPETCGWEDYITNVLEEVMCEYERIILKWILRKYGRILKYIYK
jgi:hypothetical protein